MIKEMQKSLFKPPELSSNGRLFAKTTLINFDRNYDVAFGITRTGLNKRSYGFLENTFFGMRNIKIPLEMLSMQNAGEILAVFFATGDLKRRSLHRDPNTPHDFFRLINYINKYSHKYKEFRSLEDEFKKCFDIEQEKRLEFLEQSVRDRFVESFLAAYRSPPNDFDDPNCYGEDKGIYAKIIYEELKSLSDRAKQI
ncbi:hypothetical protein ES703_08891 [subsurface metagenome]